MKIFSQKFYRISRATIVTLGLSLGLWGLPAQAQSIDPTEALVEALRLAAPDTGIVNDGLYSDWQIMPENIVSWSKFCKQPTTPEVFEANPGLAWEIMTCVVGDLLNEEYAASGEDLAVAVLRSASWWMTGDSTRYLTDVTTAEYAQQVLEFYLAQ